MFATEFNARIGSKGKRVEVIGGECNRKKVENKLINEECSKLLKIVKENS